MASHNGNGQASRNGSRPLGRTQNPALNPEATSYTPSHNSTSLSPGSVAINNLTNLQGTAPTETSTRQQQNIQQRPLQLNARGRYQDARHVTREPAIQHRGPTPTGNTGGGGRAPYPPGPYHSGGSQLQEPSILQYDGSRGVYHVLAPSPAIPQPNMRDYLTQPLATTPIISQNNSPLNIQPYTPTYHAPYGIERQQQPGSFPRSPNLVPNYVCVPTWNSPPHQWPISPPVNPSLRRGVQMYGNSNPLRPASAFASPSPLRNGPMYGNPSPQRPRYTFVNQTPQRDVQMYGSSSPPQPEPTLTTPSRRRDLPMHGNPIPQRPVSASVNPSPQWSLTMNVDPNIATAIPRLQPLPTGSPPNSSIDSPRLDTAQMRMHFDDKFQEAPNIPNQPRTPWGLEEADYINNGGALSSDLQINPSHGTANQTHKFETLGDVGPGNRTNAPKIKFVTCNPEAQSPRPDPGCNTRSGPRDPRLYNRNVENGACIRCKINHGVKYKTENGTTSSQCNFPSCQPCINAEKRQNPKYCIRYSKDNPEFLPCTEDTLRLIASSPIDLSKLTTITGEDLIVYFTIDPRLLDVSPTFIYKSSSDSLRFDFPWQMLDCKLEEFIKENIHIGIQLPEAHAFTKDETRLLDQFILCSGYLVLLTEFPHIKYRTNMHDNELLPAKYIAMRMLELLLKEYSSRFGELLDKSYEWLIGPQLKRRMEIPTYVLSGLYRLILLQSTSQTLPGLPGGLADQARHSLPNVKKLAKFAARKLDKKKTKGKSSSFAEYTDRILPNLPQPTIFVTHTSVPGKSSDYPNPSAPLGVRVETNPFGKTSLIDVADLINYPGGMNPADLRNLMKDDSTRSESTPQAGPTVPAHDAGTGGTDSTFTQSGDDDISAEILDDTIARMEPFTEPFICSIPSVANMGTYHFDEVYCTLKDICKTVYDDDTDEWEALRAASATDEKDTLSSKRPRSSDSSSSSGRSRSRQRQALF